MPLQHDLENGLRSSYETQVVQELASHNHATIQDVEHSIASIQTRQEARRELMDITRLAPFMHKMNQFEQIVEAVASSGISVAPIWADLKLILETSSALPAAFDSILDAYQSIGEVLPACSSLQDLLQSYPETVSVLRIIYNHILDLHNFVVPLLKRTGKYGPSSVFVRDIALTHHLSLATNV